MHTYSRNGKSPHWFYVMRNRLEELEQWTQVIVQDINSFAVFCRNAYTNSVTITFTWLSSSMDAVFGHQETVILPYDKLMAFLYDSVVKNESSELKLLSLKNSSSRPKLIFKSRENLHAVLSNGVVRRKLVRFIRDNFNWPRAKQIEFHDDFLPYSFTFQEIRGGKSVMTGGLILHRQEDLKQAYYGIHT